MQYPFHDYYTVKEGEDRKLEKGIYHRWHLVYHYVAEDWSRREFDDDMLGTWTPEIPKEYMDQVDFTNPTVSYKQITGGR